MPSVASSLPFSSSSLFLILYILLSSLFHSLRVLCGRKKDTAADGRNEGKRVVLQGTNLCDSCHPSLLSFFLSLSLSLLVCVLFRVLSLSVFDGGGREEGG